MLNNPLFAHPKGVLMYLVGFFLLFFLLYLILNIKNKRKDIYRAYILYVFFITVWVLSNAYFHSSLLVRFDSNIAKIMGLVATASFTFSGLVFYYFSCLMRFGRKNITNLSWFLITSIAAINLFFNTYPNLTVKDVSITDVGKFELIFSFGNSLIFLIGVVMLIVSYRNFFITLKHQKIRLENVRFFYIFLGMSLMYFSAVLFMIILPTFFNTYDYVWIPPFFSILDLLIVGYAVLTKRFLDIRLLISNLLKAAISFAFATGFATLLIVLNKAIFELNSQIPLYIIAFMLGIFLYIQIYKYLNSHTFYRVFGLSDTQHLRQVIHDMKEENRVYKSIEALEKDLQRVLSTKNKRLNCQIVAINIESHEKYPNLTRHFKRRHHILVTEEVKFVENEKKKLFPLLQELESLGGVCLPLYAPNKELIGLFALGKKRYDHLYSKEEIEALESMGSYLSMVVNDILYSTELEREVREKTTQLRKKIKEANELIEQQSDFIAVTAHEFRTPLSVALFQMEDTLSRLDPKDDIKEELNAIESSISDLYQLTKNLFEVQKYDVKSVPLKVSQVNIKDFALKIYEDFAFAMKEKEIDFHLDNQLEEGFTFELDRTQIKQVLHNLLSNAHKFTPESGEVTLKVYTKKGKLYFAVIDTGEGVPDTEKKNIFKKFKGNHSLQGMGIGLGLYIVSKILELHQGRIWVEDTPGGGATFVVELFKEK